MVENIKLTNASIAAIEEAVGMTYKEIISCPATDIDRKIEEKYDIKLDYNYNEEDPHILTRGSVFITLCRFLFTDKKIEYA